MKKISIVITAYNHEKYISTALDSAILQEGDFIKEIIIRDDSSTDNTSLIVDNYTNDYPGLIINLPSDKNIGVTKNIQRCLQASSGDYIAFLEGDDYWINPYKLKKQMELLEKKPECAFCFNALELYSEKNGEFTLHPAQKKLVEDERTALTISELIRDNFIGNFSCCMYRKSVIDQLPSDLFDLYVVDWMFNICCARYGRIAFLKEKMSVYRIHDEGAWSGQETEKKYLTWLKYANIYDKYLKYEYKDDFAVLKSRLFWSLVRQLPKNRTGLKKLFYFWLSYRS